MFSMGFWDPKVEKTKMAPLGAPGFRCLSILETLVQVNASHSPAHAWMFREFVC